jgi:hypothetical protein
MKNNLKINNFVEPPFPKTKHWANAGRTGLAEINYEANFFVFSFAFKYKYLYFSPAFIERIIPL